MAKVTRSKAKHLTVVFIGTFITAAIIGFGSQLFVEKVSALVLALLFLLGFIILHIVFDIIAVAAMSANQVPFHAKAANKIRGAGQAVRIIRNADVVANICADVVGDITSTMSGAIAAGIALDLIKSFNQLEPYEILTSTGVLAMVAALTVAGKAWGKTFGLNRADDIVFWVGKFLSGVESVTGREIFKTGKQVNAGKLSKKGKLAKDKKPNNGKKN